MKSKPDGGRADQTLSGAPVQSKRLIRWHIAVPVVVGITLVVMIILPARQLLTPAVAVQVRPVLPAIENKPDQTLHAAVADKKTGPRASRSVQAPGWLEPDPYLTACTALADGVVKEILALEGQSVKKDQTVAKLVDDDARLAVASTQADLAIAKSALRNAEAIHAAAMTDWEEPVARDRDTAQAAADLEQIKAELERLPSLINAQEAQLEQVQEDAQRVEQVYKKGAATQTELLIHQARVRERSAHVQAMKQMEHILKARLMRANAQHKAAKRAGELRVEERRALDTSTARVAEAKASVAHAQVKLDEAKLRLDRMTIRAPIAGRVLSRLKTPGDKVMLGMDNMHSSHILHLYDPAQIQVRVDVPLADAAQIYVGQKCEVIVEVLPDQTFAGEVTRITHQADLQKNTLQVKVRVLEPSPVLRPDMLTRVRFLADGPSTNSNAQKTHTTSATVRVAKSCIDKQPDGRLLVWKVQSRRGLLGTAQPIELAVTNRDGDWWTVTGNLNAGDLLIEQPISLSQQITVRIERAAEGGAA